MTLSDLGLELRWVDNLEQIQDTDEHVIFTDSLFFTKELMQDFIVKSQEAKSNTVCAAKIGVTTTRSVVATQDVNFRNDYIEYDLRYVPGQNIQSNDSIPVVLDVDSSYQSIPMPEHMIGDSVYRIPFTDTLIIQIDHWANLWVANIASLLANAARLEKSSKLKLIGLALKAFSLNQWKIMHQTNEIGRNCDIHPTAYVEGSIIGDNVTIGANTTIRESIIGNNTYFGDNATIHLAVLGDNCNIQSGSLIEYAVLYPGVLSNDRLIAISMCGRDCFIGGNVIFTNFRIDRQNIMVIKDNKLIDSGNVFLGSCIGHDVYLGAGCTIAPGRTIPNGTRLAPEHQHIIRKCVPGEDVLGYRRIEIA